MQPLLQTTHLSFAHPGNDPVVQDVHLLVPEGSLYGLLGPNGAGKSTLLKLIAGLWRPTKGDIRIFGRPLAQQQPTLYKRIGLQIEGPQLYHHLSGRENLRVFATCRGLPEKRIDELLALTGMTDHAYRKVGAYSTGMKQRLGIALALLPDPELLILDEPTNGLDPTGIADVRALLHHLQQAGKTLVVSSHLLAEMEQICTHVGLLHQGRLIAQGPIGELMPGNGQTPLRIECAAPEQALPLLPGAVRGADGLLHLEVPGKEHIPPLLEQLRQAGILVYQVRITPMRLEERYLSLIKEQP